MWGLRENMCSFWDDRQDKYSLTKGCLNRNIKENRDVGISYTMCESYWKEQNTKWCHFYRKPEKDKGVNDFHRTPYVWTHQKSHSVFFRVGNWGTW